MLGKEIFVSFTGHSFRRTSATLLVDAGADITELKRHGGWRSNATAEGYLGDSINNKKRTYNKITESIERGESSSKKSNLIQLSTSTLQSSSPPDASTLQSSIPAAASTSTADIITTIQNNQLHRQH